MEIETNTKGTIHDSAGGPVSLTRPWQVAIVSTAGAALLCKILLALDTYGTNDVYAYHRFFVWSRYLGVSLYRADPAFIHPPSLIHVLRFLGWLADSTPLPFQFWFRLPGILADLGGLWIVWKILGARANERVSCWALLLLAGAPPLLLISGFHGNTDTVMIFFLLLSIYLTENHGSSWAAGAAFGLAMSIKVVPLILIPAIFLYQETLRKRIEFFAATGAILLLGWSPFIFQDPEFVFRQIFGYRSFYGHWGLSYFLVSLTHSSPGFQPLNLVFFWYGAFLTLGLIIAVSFWMSRLPKRPNLFSQVGIIFMLFLSLASGFGVQYLAWLAPWVVELGAIPAAILFTASGAFLFLVYNYWSQGFPWYLADSNVVGDYQPPLDYFQVLCWISVVVVLCAAWKRILDQSQVGKVQSAPGRVLAWRLALASFVVALATYPMVMKVPGLNEEFAARASFGKDSIQLIYERADLALSSQLYQSGRYQDSIGAAKEALKLNLNSAAAYNNMASAFAALRMWDEAIESAQKAVRIKPDFQSAKNNLDWMLQEKRKESEPPGAASPPTTAAKE